MFRHLSIRSYLIIMNLILLCLLFPTVSLLFFLKTSSFRDEQLANNIAMMEKSLESRSASFVRNMALSSSQALAGYDFTFLQILMQQAVENDQEILYCYISDPTNRILVHNDVNQIGLSLIEATDQDLLAAVRADKTISSGRKITLPVRFFLTRAPIDDQLQSVQEAVIPIYSGDQFAGILRCGFSLAKLESQVDLIKSEWAVQMTDISHFQLYLVGIFFAIGVLIAGLFTRWHVRALDILNNGVQLIADGNLDHVIDQQRLSSSELVSLAGAFNIMTGKLKGTMRQLDDYSKSLEEKVVARTRELREAQKIMIKQAHEAGMAEMAVGVLHNIGNAITPAKVNAAMLADRIHKSPLRTSLGTALQSLIASLEEQKPLSGKDREYFLDILKLLPESLKEEFDLIVRDLDSIREKHDHIETIINLQMRYARLAGHQESVNLKRITNDAIKILSDALRNRNIQLINEVADVPNVHMEEAMLLQILINVIKNGYEAIDAAPENDRILTISASVDDNDPSFVILSIHDSGIGFSPEEKENLFHFGYTTKTTGSGFGLHSCANYLIANKGSIEAYSSGKHLGSEFIIRIPTMKDHSEKSAIPQNIE